MTDEQTRTAIDLLTEIREELILHRTMFEYQHTQKSRHNMDVTVRFENAPANLDRARLDELKRTLVYQIQRGAVSTP